MNEKGRGVLGVGRGATGRTALHSIDYGVEHGYKTIERRLKAVVNFFLSFQ
jgi:hypothetical protein